jgi:acyl-CoA synthetase (AMP-forming)/AMP-acid ligase II
MRPEVIELELISDYPAYWAGRHPEREAMVLGAERLSYRTLAGRVDRAARALMKAGLGHGDRIAMLAPTGPEPLIVFLAAAKLGAIWTGLNWRFRTGELGHVIEDADASLVIASTHFRGRDYRGEITRLARARGERTRFITLGEAVPGLTLPYGDFLAGADLVDPVALAAAGARTRGSDAALLVYTSGSTGRPKGAMLSHRGLIHCSHNQCDHWWAEPLRVINNLPISNVFCIGDLYCYTLVGGGTALFMERFDARGVLETIATERASVWGQVPTMFQLALDHPDFARFDLASLQLIFWAGARCPRELIARLARIAPNLSTNYGLTETVAGVTYTEPGASFEVLAETVGKPDPRYELRIVDGDGRVLGDGVEGEIEIRGECRMIGYYKRPEATAAVIDPEGWVHSGDLGLRRSDGNYRVIGRLSDMYKSGGFNVYPREIELVLETHPGVAMAAVIGEPDALYGEVGRAFVLARPGESLSKPELAEWCRARLADFKVPKRFSIRDELPMLPVGKVDKAALRFEASREEVG